VLAVGPATLQVCGTIDPDEFGRRFICHGITLFLDRYRDGLIDAPFGNISSILA
jgi:hypothetical protein